MEKGKMELFPTKVRRVWNKWELRILVLISLSLQIFLILFGSRRKRTYHKPVSLLLWIGYLSADWAATLAMGVLSNSQNDDCDNGPDNKYHPPDPNNNLQAFWASFLLLHLGGPDTITAFSLEDNELWLRHLFGLLFQVGVSFYIFIKTLPKTKLWPVTVLMFIAGIIKYGERTWALMLASRDNYRENMLSEPDPGPNYAKFMEEYSSKKKAGLNAKIVWEKEPHSQLPSSQIINIEEDKIGYFELISDAHHFFEIFKRLIVDLILTFQDRSESQSFFMKRSWDKAFEVIEIELGFVYDVLYTKAAVVHTHKGCIARFFSVSSIVSSFIIFFFTHKKHYYLPVDIIITYVLLGGAISLEIWSLIRLVFSDWTIVWMKKKNLNFPVNFLFKVVSYFRPFGQPRWSNSMAQQNLIKFCLKDQPSIFKEIMKLLHIKEIIDKFWYRTYTPVTNDLKSTIFEDLKDKLAIATDSASYKHLSTCRGEMALEKMTTRDDEIDRSIKVEFDESILLWHLATDICYYGKEEQESPKDLGLEKQEHLDCLFRCSLSRWSRPCLSRCFSCLRKNPEKQEHPDGQEHPVDQKLPDRSRSCLCRWSRPFLSRCSCFPKHPEKKENPDGQETTIRDKEKSRNISNYMLYLLVSRPSMLTAGIGQIRYGDTCAEAKKFFNRVEKETNEKRACDQLIAVNTEVSPIEVKGDRSKSVLFDASRLAKSLLNLEREKRWKLICNVWLEMLYYAASHCRGNYHAQRLSAGGELLTVVWFLLAHLGIGEQYRVESGHARAKLIVEM